MVKNLIKVDIPVKQAKVAILGFTFKENCPDTRNTRVIDIVNELAEYGITPIISDPVADTNEAKHEYGLELDSMESIRDVDALVIAVAHDEFTELTMEKLDSFYKDVPNSQKVLIDVKGLFDRREYEKVGYIYWRL